MNLDKMYGHNPWLKRHKPNSYDPEEFNNRVNNYKLCLTKFVSYFDTSDKLKNQLKRIDVDKYCMEERKALIDFAETTNFKYESVWAPLNHDLERLYKQ
jgi:hypothetical protein